VDFFNMPVFVCFLNFTGSIIPNYSGVSHIEPANSVDPGTILMWLDTGDIGSQPVLIPWLL
jgi:hypothetical protein